jgi:hypothetical protein
MNDAIEICYSIFSAEEKELQEIQGEISTAHPIHVGVPCGRGRSTEEDQGPGVPAY